MIRSGLWLIVGGYAAACLVAGLILGIAEMPASESSFAQALGAYVSGSFGAAVLTGTFGAIPLVMMIGFAESSRIRSAGYYVGLGVILGFVLYGLLHGLLAALLEYPSGFSTSLGRASLAGAAWGATYWVIAGRHAGGRVSAE